MKTNVNNTAENMNAAPVVTSCNETPRHLAADFLTAQKFANEAAADLAAQWDTDENAAAYALTATAGTRIFEVTTGRAETLRTHARRAADKIAAALTITPAAAADLLAEVLTHWHNNMIIRESEADETPDTIESESEPQAEAVAAPAGTLARAARVFLLALTLTAAPAAADTTDEPQAADVAELLTPDPLAEVAALQAAGLTVSHVTIKSAPAC